MYSRIFRKKNAVNITLYVVHHRVVNREPSNELR